MVYYQKLQKEHRKREGRNLYFEEYYVGQKFYPEPIAITQEDIEAFAKRYDPLPLHLDPAYAKTGRFGGIIASGFHTLCAFWSQWVRMGKGGTEVLAGVSIDSLHWTAPVYPGDTLSGEVEVVDLIPTPGGEKGILVVRATAYNQNGTAVMDVQVRSLHKRRNGSDPA